MTCQELYELAWSGKRFRFPRDGGPFDVSMLPENGVYLMFEEGETAHGGERIVRVGINRDQGKLRKRIKDHYKKQNGKSILRRHVKKCFRYSDNAQEETTRYIHNNITFVVIEIGDKKERKAIEKGLIGLVAQCTHCSASEAWLGHKWPLSKRMRRSFDVRKLWNAQELLESPLDLRYDTMIREGLVK